MYKRLWSAGKLAITFILVICLSGLPGMGTDIFAAQAAVKTQSIKLSKSTDYLNQGETFTFQAKVSGTDEKVKWSVSDKTIATISTKGKLTAVKAGTVTVKAKAGTVEKKCKVTVGTGRLSTLSTDLILYEDKTIYINVRDTQPKETITYEHATKDVIRCKWGEWIGNTQALTIHVINAGRETLEISTNHGKEKLILHITVKKPSERKELSAKELYQLCGPSTVEISAKKLNRSSIGSGFFSAQNRVVTNYHVIAGADQITVTTHDNKELEVLKIIGFDASLDIAVLEVNAKGYSPLALGSGNVSVGDTVYALGSPLGLTGTMTNGMVSSASRVMDGVDYIQITAPISQGNSGGPLINSDGEVVGINTMYLENGQNLNFSINIQELMKVKTDQPMTVEEYSSGYWKKLSDYTNTMEEDPILSQDTRTCQSVPADTKVTGTIRTADYLRGDVYRIKVTEEGLYFGCAILNSVEDLNNTYLELYDSDIKRITGCYRNEKELMDYTMYNLTPGDYYIFICVDRDYSGPDISYSMVLSYQ